MSPADFSALAGQQDSRDDCRARTVDRLPYQLTTPAAGDGSGFFPRFRRSVELRLSAVAVCAGLEKTSAPKVRA
jgi:hypothetical protein